MRIGYTLASEEHGPEDLVRFARRAEEVGFDFGFISDHFHPWTTRQGQSPFVWSVLGAIAQSTRTLRVGTGVTCPTHRVHPAIVAQAAATASRLFAGRFFLGLGSGENLNEHIVGGRWPDPGTRLEMLSEAIDMIRELWRGERVTRHGRYFTVDEARIFTLPEAPPPIYVAASGALSARLAGRAGDGLIGLAPERALLEKFEDEGGSGKPRLGQLHLCYGKSEQAARRQALECWPNSALGGNLFTEIKTTELFDAAVELVREEDMERLVCGPDADAIADAVRAYADAGYDELALHQVGPDQEGFLRFFESELQKKLP